MAIINHNGKEYEYDPRAVRVAMDCEVNWFSPIIERTPQTTEVVYKGLVEYDGALGCAIHFWSLPETEVGADGLVAFDIGDGKSEWIDQSILDEGWCPDTDGGFHLFLDFWIKTHTHWTLDHVVRIDDALDSGCDFHPGGAVFDHPIKEEWSCNVFNEVPAGWTPVSPSFVNRYTEIHDKDGNVDFMPSLLPIFDTYFYDYKFTCESGDAWSENDTLNVMKMLVVPLLPHYFGEGEFWNHQHVTILPAPNKELSLLKVKEIFDTHDINFEHVAGWMDLLEVMPRVCMQILNWFIEYHQTKDPSYWEDEALNEIISYTAYFLSELYPELHAEYLGNEAEQKQGVLNCLKAVAEQNEE